MKVTIKSKTGECVDVVVEDRRVYVTAKEMERLWYLRRHRREVLAEATFVSRFLERTRD